MTSTEPALVPGSLFAAKYRVERTLGEGGMGIVVEATHAKLGQRVAIKILRVDSAVRADIIARFQREARIAAQLTSEHVARVTDMGQTASGQPYLVMELLEGHDLHTEIHQGGPQPIAVAVDYIVQACEALAEAHAAGLVHRDVKPANLFIAKRPLGRAPIVKVLDFGLSKAPDGESLSLTRTASSFGTPQYMSPEQMRSTKHVDARTDQHALALVLYELLSGAPAYQGPSPAAVAVNIATQSPPHVRDVRPDVPHELNDAIVRALAKEPDDRFADVGRFARAIAPFGSPRAAESLMAISAALASERRVAGASGTEPQVASVPRPAPRPVPRPAPPPAPSSDIGDDTTERVSEVGEEPRAPPVAPLPPVEAAPVPSPMSSDTQVARPVPSDPPDDAATLPTRSLTAAAEEARRIVAGGTIPMPHVLEAARVQAIQAVALATPPPPTARQPADPLSPASFQPGPHRLAIVLAICAVTLVATVLVLLWVVGRGPFGG